MYEVTIGALESSGNAMEMFDVRIRTTRYHNELLSESAPNTDALVHASKVL
jgi:hypothetical protein